MRKNLPLFLLLIAGFILSTDIFSQDCVVTGKVTDEETSELMPFVNIGIKGSSAGTFSDSNGFYRIVIPDGDHKLVVTCVGYERRERNVSVNGQKELVVDFIMSQGTEELNTVVVTGSKYEQKVQESIASIEVLKASSIHSSNPQSIDQAIDKIPGITIVDNEPQIRGGERFQFRAWKPGDDHGG